MSEERHRSDWVSLEDPAAPGSPQHFALRLAPRPVRGLGLIAGVGFTIAWCLLVLPLLFQSPHSFTLCSKGGCTVVMPKDYYANLELATAFLLGAGVGSFLLALLMSRARPTELLVDAAGFTVAYGSKRQERVSWDDPKLSCQVVDRREVIRVRPGYSTSWPTPVALKIGSNEMYPPYPAIEAIVSSAEAGGVTVQKVQGERYGFPETVVSVLLPPSVAPPTSAPLPAG